MPSPSTHMADLHGNLPYVWRRRQQRQELEGARKSLVFQADENDARPAVATAMPEDDGLATSSTQSSRLQEIRRRMGRLGKEL